MLSVVIVARDAIRMLLSLERGLLAALRKHLQPMRRPDLSTAVAASACSLQPETWLLLHRQGALLINDDMSSSAALAMTMYFHLYG
jgi:hypothetical protein